MKFNFLFILIIFLLISFIFVIFPNQLEKKYKINKKDKIIKLEMEKDYSALILKNKDNREKINNVEPKKEFKIFNVRVTNQNLEDINTFLFSESIYVNFDYELPEGNYIFRIELDLEEEVTQNKDIVRTGKGRTDKEPISFKIKSNNNLKDLHIENINILVYLTNNYDNPLFTYSHKLNITVENLKINLIREEDFTSPLLLGKFT